MTDTPSFPLDKENGKEVSLTPQGQKRDLFVFRCLKAGLSPAQISDQFSINKKTLQHYISSLKSNGYIKKIGYGVWQILKEFDAKTSLKTRRVGKDAIGEHETSLKPDTVRGHGFLFVLDVPRKLHNWLLRADILRKANIPFQQVNTLGNRQQILFKGRKIQLTDRKVLVFEPASYMADTAKDSHSYAIIEFLELVKSLERYVGASFISAGRYRFKVARQHYALVKNALAKQYDKEKKKLHCYTADGLWFEIDNSFNLHEAETLHPKTAVDDNEKVQDFFNGIKEGWADEVMKDLLHLKEIAKGSSQAQMDMTMWMQQVDSNMKEIIRRLPR